MRLGRRLNDPSLPHYYYYFHRENQACGINLTALVSVVNSGVSAGRERGRHRGGSSGARDLPLRPQGSSWATRSDQPAQRPVEEGSGLWGPAEPLGEDALWHWLLAGALQGG